MRTLPAWSVRGVSAATAFAGFMLAPAAAWADEPRTASEPRIMMESGEVTNVIDAFDDGDPFDINVSLGFEFSSKSAKILRETQIKAPGLTTGGFTSNLLNVAKYSESTSKLIPRVDIGIYKDLAAHISLPIILSNARELTGLNGSDQPGKIGVALAGAPGEQLFNLPFTSPKRSGLEYIAAGIDVDILNQARDRTKPTWLFGVEGRFSVGPPMHACTKAPKKVVDAMGQPTAIDQVECADPSDINRNGNADAGGFEGSNFVPRGAGVNRGIIGLNIHTMMSKRYKYIEPYGGFDAVFEFQQKSSDYGITDLEESLVNHPPLVGSMILGIMVIPWEHREKFGRLTFDVRFMGTYHSEGRDYAELFDPLGASDAPSLRQPQWERYQANPAGTNPRSVIDPSSQRTYTTGLSDVSAFGSYRVSGGVTWQASEYVKFSFGMGYKHDQSHSITGDQPCNPATKSAARMGPCHSGDESLGQPVTPTGLPNPNYRPTINAVGRRFFVDDSNTFDLFASGVVMF